MGQTDQYDVFLSYSSHDKTVVRALAERLRRDGLKVWFDEWVIRVGDSMPHQIEAGLEYSTVLVLCMAAQAFASDWATLESQTFRFRDPLNKQRRFIPLLLTDATIPGSLPQFTYVDWRGNQEQAYRVLLEACEQARTALAGATLAQAVQAAPPLAPPSSASPSPSSSPAIKTDIDRITRYAPEQLLGRETETAMLSAAWQQATASTSPGAANRAHIISLVALGGEGKTALLARWVLDLAAQDWPGCEAVFAWSFYSQGSEQHVAASSELFIDAALRFFGEAELAASNQSGMDKARQLAQVVGAQRVLLLLDGLEPLQYAPTAAMAGELRDGALAQLLRSLASHSLGLCVLTTRYSIPDLKAFWRTTAPEHPLTRLAVPAGVALLKLLGLFDRPASGECIGALLQEPVIAGLTEALFIEWISGNTIDLMVGPVHNELHTARQGAKLANDQAVTNEWKMI